MLTKSDSDSSLLIKPSSSNLHSLILKFPSSLFLLTTELRDGDYTTKFLFIDLGVGESNRSTWWLPEDNKAFEDALALFDEKMPDRWQKVAAMVPGKTVWDIMRHYKELEDDVSSIEAGLFPVPGYSTISSSPYLLEYGGSGHHYCRKSSTAAARTADQESKKGVPWTEDEHKLFLMGLKKYGRGDWRNISRNFVITRTPTQVASHAQKYFIRQLNSGKDKRRASIHDITTQSLEEDSKTPIETTRKSPSPEQSPVQKLAFPWSHSTNELLGSQGVSNVFGSIPVWQHLQGETGRILISSSECVRADAT